MNQHIMDPLQQDTIVVVLVSFRLNHHWLKKFSNHSA
jgi:hypothetical protein